MKSVRLSVVILAAMVLVGFPSCKKSEPPPTSVPSQAATASAPASTPISDMPTIPAAATTVTVPAFDSTIPPKLDEAETFLLLNGAVSVGLGMSEEQVLAALGKPEVTKGKTFFYHDLGITFQFGKKGADRIDVYAKTPSYTQEFFGPMEGTKSFMGSTSHGIKGGATSAEIVATYGTPVKDESSPGNAERRLKYPAITFFLRGDHTCQIELKARYK